jgi:hypothetical protein
MQWSEANQFQLGAHGSRKKNSRWEDLPHRSQRNSDEGIDCSQHMNIAFLSALFALAGSVIGGLTSGVTTWLGLRVQARAGQLALEMSRRDDLYRDFIVAASEAYGDAMLSNEPEMPQLIALYAMVSRMRVLSSPRTVASAEKVMGKMLDAYFAPNKTIRELHELMKSGADIDPLKDFSEDAREELRAFTSS